MTLFLIDINAMTEFAKEHPNELICVRDYLTSNMFTKIECVDAVIVHSQLTENADDNENRPQVAICSVKLKDSDTIYPVAMSNNLLTCIESYMHNADMLALNEQDHDCKQLEEEMQSEQDEDNLQTIERQAGQQSSNQESANKIGKPIVSMKPTVNGQDITAYPPIVVRGDSASDLKEFVDKNKSAIEAIGNEIAKQGLPTLIIPLDTKDKELS